MPTTNTAGYQAMRPAYRELTGEEHVAMAKIKGLGAELWDEVHKLSSQGSRELSIAKTKLEEAVMWAVKHITG